MQRYAALNNDKLPKLAVVTELHTGTLGKLPKQKDLDRDTDKILQKPRS